MKGVVLAGGMGKRLREISGGRNKQTVEVNGRPMIEFPLKTLGAMGCTDVTIVTSPEGYAPLKLLVDYGGQHELNVDWAIQPEPRGMGDALYQARYRVGGVFPVLCGDVYFDPAPITVIEKPLLVCHSFEGGRNHIVVDTHEDGSHEVVLRPTKANSDRAIVGYVFDEEVFDFIPTIKPSPDKNEIEFADIYSWYINERGATVADFEGMFADMGTPAGIARVEEHIRNRQA
ncbi:sugar nucleotidyltransferase [Candidatus Saccharibacteria bacterium]|nr:sugar nucleotidyltransferase [Candidatus Saccharibacteria bacterium]